MDPTAPKRPRGRPRNPDGISHRGRAVQLPDAMIRAAVLAYPAAPTIAEAVRLALAVGLGAVDVQAAIAESAATEARVDTLRATLTEIRNIAGGAL